MSKENETLENFGGWDSSNPNEFFGTPGDTVEPLEPKDDIEEDDAKKEKEEEDTDKMKWFEPKAGDEEEEEILKAEEEEEEPIQKVSPRTTLEYLKEKGLVSYELAEGEKLTDAKAEEILEDSYDNSVAEGVEEVIKELPDSVKDIIRFAQQGGDISLLLNKMARGATAQLTADTDMTIEANQIMAVSMDLEEQGYDQEYIDTHVGVLKDSGKLASIAEKAFKKFSEKDEKERKDEVDRIAAQNKDRKEKARLYRNNLSEQISTLEDVSGFKLSKEDKNGSLAAYIADGAVTLQDGRVVTAMQADILRAMGSYEKTIALAKVLRLDFNFSTIANSAVTKAAKEVKTEIENSKNIDLKGKRGSSQPKARNLADLLGD